MAEENTSEQGTPNTETAGDPNEVSSLAVKALQDLVVAVNGLAQTVVNAPT